MAGYALVDANRLFDEGKFSKASEVYASLLCGSKNGTMVEARANYAGCLLELGGKSNTERAVDICSTLVKEIGISSPASATVLYTRAEGHWNMKRVKLAACDCTLAIRCDPNLVNPWCLRAATHNYFGAFEEAVKDLDRALALRPRYVQALLHRGVARFKLQQYVGALNDFEKASELSENSSSAAHQWFERAKEKVQAADSEAKSAARDLLVDVEKAQLASVRKRRNRRRRKARAKAKSQMPTASLEKDESKVEATPQSMRVKKSLHNDLFNIEVTAIVDTVFAVSTARVLGRNHAQVDEQLALRMATNMHDQTKLGMVRALREQYVNEKIRRWFREESDNVREEATDVVNSIFEQLC